MAKQATTIKEAITSGLMKAFLKSNVQFRKVNGKEFRFTLTEDQNGKQILIHNAKNVLIDTYPESDFPK